MSSQKKNTDRITEVKTCRWMKVFSIYAIYGPRLYYVDFMYIENKGSVVRLLHKFNALVYN